VVIRITDPEPIPDPYRNIGKTRLGGGFHCPSAFSLIFVISSAGFFHPDMTISGKDYA